MSRMGRFIGTESRSVVARGGGEKRLFSSGYEQELPSSCNESFSLQWLLLLQSTGCRTNGLQ